MNQTAFIDNVMEGFEVTMSFELPATALADLGLRRDDEDGEDWPFKVAVGCLLWLSMMTRLDIANAVRVVAIYSHKPRARHWTTV